MRLRQSDLKLFSRCPLAWRFQNIDHQPREQSGSLTFGTLIHAAVLRLEVSRDVEGAVDWFHQAWHDPAGIEEGLEPTYYVRGTSWRAYLDSGERVLRDWWSLIQWERDVVLAREYHFVVPIGDHELEGTVDKLAIRYLGKTDEYVVLLSDYKGLALDTPLPTPDGWTTMGKVMPGDDLVGGDGAPCRVTGTSQIHHRDCYRITFSDGTSVVADAEHLWEVEVGYVKPYDVKILATADLVDHLRNPVTGQRQLRIPYVAMDFKERGLPLDPYVLGAWLGDGAAADGRITKPLPRLFQEIKARGFEVGPDISSRDRSTTRTVYGLRTVLREMGLLQNKHIPAGYLRGSRQQRLDLLRGVMDTDGHWNFTRKRCVLNTTDEHFARQVRELALSLGYGAVTFATTAHGFGRFVDAWQTWFTPVGDEVFLARLPADYRVTPPAKSGRRLISAVERIPTVPTRCVEVDSPDSTYLCGEQMVRTHNTTKREPTYGYLAHDLQFTAYCYATTRPEFWGGLPDGLEMFQRHVGKRRLGEWVQLLGPKRMDAGERNQLHYNRLRYAVGAVADAITWRIFTPNISGETCLYCDFRQVCGLPSREEEMALTLGGVT